MITDSTSREEDVNTIHGTIMELLLSSPPIVVASSLLEMCEFSYREGFNAGKASREHNPR